MSTISKQALPSLGQRHHTTEKALSTAQEQQLREVYFGRQQTYRKLLPTEISILEQHNNYAADWDKVLVTDPFIPEQIQHVKFYGLVRIGAMSAEYLSYRDLNLPIGIYHTTVISCDIGDYNAIHHVKYLAHFVLGRQVMLSNINEMETSSRAKFGNGILHEGEAEAQRIWLELCNENGGRAIIPFEGMQVADAYLWTQHRQDQLLQDQFKAMTDRQFASVPYRYSSIGDNSVIKNSNILKDIKVGSHAYIKGVNKLKNVTVKSDETAKTQIGEGCELVNGIINYGCSIFYGVKAVRFILSSHSQLKYGARLINSFLGDNSTISCCEVLNSLLFPAHEQHHNNSFLCAALIKGQSNMAAGATIGSNHNSRAADGELQANRGFWPGLCVSLKHNSRFAAYTLLVKGDFGYELDIRLPFSLVSNDPAKNELVIIPAYWFLYNMYALMRNTSKYVSRDKRRLKNQHFEYEILAPDTVNEIFSALEELAIAVAETDRSLTERAQKIVLGRKMLAAGLPFSKDACTLRQVENSGRRVVVLKVQESYAVYVRMVRHYGISHLVDFLKNHDTDQLWERLRNSIGPRDAFENIGGQLVRKQAVEGLLENIKNGSLRSWEQVHHQYHRWSQSYAEEKLSHALQALMELEKTPLEEWDNNLLMTMLEESLATKGWICEQIESSRRKDYENPFKQMLYDNDDDMNAVVGRLDDNTFIVKEKRAFLDYKKDVTALLSMLRHG